MGTLSENQKNACFFSDFAVKYNVRHTVQFENAQCEKNMKQER